MPQQQAAGIGRTVRQLFRYWFLGPIPIATRRKETRGDQYLIVLLASLITAGAMWVAGWGLLAGWGPAEVQTDLPDEMVLLILAAPVAFGSLSVAMRESTELGNQDGAYKNPALIGSVVGLWGVTWLVFTNHTRIFDYILQLEPQIQVVSYGVFAFVEYHLLILCLSSVPAILAAATKPIRDREDQIVDRLGEFF